MSDRGHELTEELLKEIEERVKIEYEQAYREMQKKLSDYMATFEKQDAIKRQLLKEDKISAKEYRDWRYRHMMMNKRWEDMRDTLAEDMHNVNLIATRIMKDEMPQVYSLNHDYATYQIEHDARIDTSYTLYNHDTAERLLKQQQELLPKPSARKARELRENPDLVWNQQKLQSAVLQGVLQGESPYAIAQRLRSVADMNYHASVRHARTMTTNVQNAGREDAYDRAKSKGVELTEIWIATLDGRTRHSHRQMHGDKKDEKKGTFSNGLRWPGDPRGAAHEVYNCRCTTNAYVKGFEPELVTSSPKMGDMSFDEWLEAKPRNENADRKQFERYQKTLKKRAPKSFADFEKIKYENPVTWSKLKENYRKKVLENQRKSDILKRRRFNTLADPMREVFGSAEQSNPDDVKRILEDLRRSGVEIVRRQGAIGYTPSLFGGTPGQFLIEEEASFSAWAHEYKHFCDDRDSGYLGYRVFQYPEICAQREIDAYQIEIDMAIDAGRQDIADRLKKLRDKEVEKYVGRS